MIHAVARPDDDDDEDVCADGSCAPREVNLPHDSDETEDKNKPPNISLLGIEKGTVLRQRRDVALRSL